MPEATFRWFVAVSSLLVPGMVNNCVAFGCKNYVGKKEGLSFFRFPLNDRERCDKWTAAVRRAVTR